MRVSFRTFGYIGLGMYQDLRKRIPFYISDFTDAWNYRVIPSTTFVFFTNVLPAIAFAQDMLDKTNNSYGLNEVLMSSAIGGVVFGLFSAQPLCLVGVTGPISIFSYTVYNLIKLRNIPYFPFMCWVYLWSMVFHLIIAFGNLISFLKIISLYSCDVFGFFICHVYIQKGIQILSRQFIEVDLASGYCSVMISLCMIICGVGSGLFGSSLHYFNTTIRKIFVDYGVPCSVIFFTGFIHFGGQLNNTTLAKLPTTTTFEPTSHGMARAHGWFIHFWPNGEFKGWHIALAIPFAILLTFLFYFDHNVSSLMCLLKTFPLKKPSGFHWDFFLLGITTGLAGILGLPPPNGLIPQAPLHTESLVIHGRNGQPISVIEQRVSNILQGVFTFVLMTKPFLVVLGLIPQAVLAGLFFIMGITGLHGNIITDRIRYIFMDKDYVRNDPTCPQVFKDIDNLHPKKWFYIYLILQLIAFGFEFGITLTKGAVGFPGVLMVFAICAEWVWPLIIPREELDKLDGEVADDVVSQSLLAVSRYRKERSFNKEDARRESEYEVSVAETESL